MPVTCCDTIIGGRVHIAQGDKIYQAMEGSVTLRPAKREVTPGVSSSGRLFSTQTAKSQSAVLTLLNFCDADPMELFEENCRTDITIVEIDRGIRHHFTQSILSGTPEIDSANGQVTGIEVHTDQYTRVAG